MCDECCEQSGLKWFWVKTGRKMKRQKEKCVTDGGGRKKKKKTVWKERPRERGRLNECCTPEGLSWFQHSRKRFVWFRVGSAHTDISLRIHTGLCHSHEENGQCVCERAWRDSGRKYAIVRKCNPLTVPERPLETPTCYIRTHSSPPRSAAPRHFRHSASPLWPSSLRWLNGKQTSGKETPCSLSKERKKKETGMTHSWNLSRLHLVLSAIQLSIFPGDVRFIPCQHFTAIRAAIVWNALLISNAGFTVYSDPLLAAVARHRARASESVVMWYPAMYDDPTFVILTRRTRVLWLLFKL